MFIVSLSYKVDLDEIDKILPQHIKYLKAQYKQDSFIASGRKIPRTGGIILSKLNTLDELQRVLEQDPFKIHNLANYEIQEFMPSMTSDKFKNLLE
jgi:uncharacterized protein YciI